MNEGLLRVDVRQRAKKRCEYCQLPDVAPSFIRFQLEHIRAKRHGGSNALNNLAWACPRCNERKGTNLSAVDPDTNRIVRLFNPRRDVWPGHFAWNGLRIGGLTATGRATASLLDLNSDERLKFRHGLRRLGLF